MTDRTHEPLTAEEIELRFAAILNERATPATPALGPVIPPVSSAADAVDWLHADARVLLLAAAEDAVSARWLEPPFAEQVDAVRRHVAPLEEPALLTASFSREPVHGPRVGRGPAIASSPVRVAYVVRWIELQAGLILPPWHAWFP